MLHAREWAAGAAAMYVIDNLPDELLSRFRFLIIPVANPDGYAWTWQGNRFWRKNRSGCPRLPSSAIRPPFLVEDYFEACGVDLNRNFASHWGECEQGENDDRLLQDDYGGASATSEAETVALQQLFEEVREQVHLAIDVHSYGQLILYPPAWTKNDLDSKSKQAAERMQNTMADYKAKPFSAMYEACGTATDWFKDNCRDCSSVGIELRPEMPTEETGWDALAGFSLDPLQIRAVGRDLLAALKVLQEHETHK